MFPNGETVTIHRRTVAPTRDEYGADTYVETAVTYHGCAVWPFYGYEQQTPTSDQVTDLVKVAVPPTADVDSIDALTWQGRRYEVEGEPERYRTPFTGTSGPTVLNCKRVEG